MDEASIIDGMARGDREAFRELVEQYKKKVYFLALDMTGNAADAEDLSQDVFMKIHRSFGTFRKDARLGSWIYRVTYNACIDHLRKREKTPVAYVDEVLESAAADGLVIGSSSGGLDPLLATEADQLQTRLAMALEKVSPQEKAVFLLRHYDDMMLREIAETMDISVGSVKSYLFRAVRKLQKELGAPGNGMEA